MDLSRDLKMFGIKHFHKVPVDFLDIYFQEKEGLYTVDVEHDGSCWFHSIFYVLNILNYREKRKEPVKDKEINYGSDIVYSFRDVLSDSFNLRRSIKSYPNEVKEWWIDDIFRKEVKKFIAKYMSIEENYNVVAHSLSSLNNITLTSSNRKWDILVSAILFSNPFIINILESNEDALDDLTALISNYSPSSFTRYVKTCISDPYFFANDLIIRLTCNFLDFQFLLLLPDEENDEESDEEKHKDKKYIIYSRWCDPLHYSTNIFIYHDPIALHFQPIFVVLLDDDSYYPIYSLPVTSNIIENCYYHACH